MGMSVAISGTDIRRGGQGYADASQDNRKRSDIVGGETDDYRTADR